MPAVKEVVGVGHGHFLGLVPRKSDGAAHLWRRRALVAALLQQAVDRLDFVPAWIEIEVEITCGKNFRMFWDRDPQIDEDKILYIYKVTHLLTDLGWVDLDLGCSTGRWAVLHLWCCPSKTVEHPKSKSTQPRSARRLVALYNAMVEVHIRTPL